MSKKALELPAHWTPDDPRESRISDELERRREITRKNESNTARYMREPQAKQRYRTWLGVRAYLGLP